MVAVTLALPVMAGSQKNKNSERPKLPYNMMGLDRGEIDAYDSKAEPVAEATAALVAMDRTGWDLVRKYYPGLGTDPDGLEKRVNPADPADGRFFARYANEDATFSPIPLLSAVASLPPAQLSGRLLALHNQAAQALPLNHDSQWTLDTVRQEVDSMTTAAKTAQGVKYRTPKTHLSFAQAVQLYAMTIALLGAETKWADKADSPPPDMVDFSNRLSHQLPRAIGDGATLGFLLYRPGIVNHPLAKDDFEERADVVLLSRNGSWFEVEQFPVYLTADQKEWNPGWIEARDEVVDSTLVARKFEHDWTRLDGPYLWYLPYQFNGRVVYRATIKFSGEAMVIEAEREIESRGTVKRALRPRDYDPLQMTPFLPGQDAVAQAADPQSVEPPGLEDQLRSWLSPPRYFSNRFRAWCAYGLWNSGLAGDGRTWISVVPDQPRSESTNPTASNISVAAPQGQSAAQP